KVMASRVIVVLRSLGASERERHDRPARGVARNELVLLVRESGFEICLERLAPGLHVPGAVVLLRPEEPGEALPIGAVRDRDAARLGERREHAARRIGIALALRQLRPAAVLALRGQKLLRGILEVLRFRGG